MNRNFFKRIAAAFFLTFIFCAAASASVLDSWAQNGRETLPHPFLLTDGAHIAEIKRLAQSGRWKDMADAAIAKAQSASVISSPAVSFYTRCYSLRDVVSSNAVAYLLDENNAEVYRAKILDAIAWFASSRENNLYDEIYTSDGDNWNSAIPPGCAFFNCVLALDIIYPSLTAAQINSAENALSGVADKFWAATEVHLSSTWGVRGLWAMYRQDWALLREIYDIYLPLYDENFSPDGGQLSSTEYAVARYASGERVQKFLLFAALERNGLVDDFYADPRHQKAMENMLGYTYAPSGEWWVIGDTLFGNRINGGDLPAAYGAYNYSETAAGYAAYLTENDTEGTLLKFLLTDGEARVPQKPQSRIFPNNSAFFYEDISKVDSLAGFLYSPDRTNSTSGHIHKEVNSIGLYGYGEMLMANAGYNYFGNACNGFSWDYIFNRAISANTLLLNYNYGNIRNPNTANDHVRRYGDGIKNGFITERMSWARGDSGSALSGAAHERSFVMVGGRGSLPGYFVTFDHVAASPGDTVTIVQRPASAVYSEVETNVEYEWTVSRNGYGAKLSVFMAKNPTAVEFVDGVIASQGTQAQNIKSLLSKYTVGVSGILNAATVLFPSGSAHMKPDLQRLHISGANGAQVQYPEGTIDYVVASESVTPCDIADGISFTGKNAVIRIKNASPVMYFGEEVRALSCGESGISAENAVSVFMDGTKGTLSANEEGTVTFFAENISGIKINGQYAGVRDLGKGYLRVDIPAGTHEIELIYGGEDNCPVAGNAVTALFSEDFSSSGGTVPAPFMTSGEAGVDSEKGALRLSADYADGGAEPPTATLRLWRDFGGRWKIKFRLYAEEDGGTLGIMFKDEFDRQLDVFRFIGGRIYAQSQYLINDGIFDPETWHDITIELNTQTGCFAAFIDEKAYIMKAAADSEFLFENAGLVIENSNGQSGIRSQWLVDDFEILTDNILFESDFEKAAAGSRPVDGWANAGGSGNTAGLSVGEYGGGKALRFLTVSSGVGAPDACAVFGGFFKSEWSIKFTLDTVAIGDKFEIGFREAGKEKNYWYSLLKITPGAVLCAGDPVYGLSLQNGGRYDITINADLWDNTVSVYIDGVRYACDTPFTAEAIGNMPALELRFQSYLSAAGRAEYYADNLRISYDSDPKTVLDRGVCHLTRGDAYLESGARAYDFYEGEITDRIVVSGNVDTSVPGVYEIDYRAATSDGRLAGTVRRKVIVYPDDPYNLIRYADDFEATPTGAVSSALDNGWTANIAGGNAAYLGTVPFDGGRALRLYTKRVSVSAAAEATAAKTLDLNGKHRIDFDLYTGAAGNQIYVCAKELTHSLWASFLLYDGFSLKIMGGASKIAVRNNEWYGVSIRINSEKNTATVYVDGTLCADNVRMFNAAQYDYSLVSFRIQNYNQNAGSETDVYIDNYMLYCEKALTEPAVSFLNGGRLVGGAAEGATRAVVSLPDNFGSAKIIAARYGGGAMTGCATREVSVTGGAGRPIELTWENAGPCDRAGVFILEGFDKMTPKSRARFLR